jgi:Na+-driven multidrug efflux pump
MKSSSNKNDTCKSWQPWACRACGVCCLGANGAAVALQAYGSHAYDALGVIFQRTVLFMLAHCIPITLVQLGVPELLRLAGEDSELCTLASSYARRLLPSLYLEAFSR